MYPRRAVYVVAAVLLASSAAHAQRAVRIDGGLEWFNSDPLLDSELNVSTGLNIDFLGFDLSTVTINRNGSIGFDGASISPLFDPSYDPLQMVLTYSRTTGDPSGNPLPAGIENGFRVNWAYGEPSNGTPPQNLFQLSLYELLIGADSYLAMEFNYESVLFGGADSFIGYEAGAVSFDLLDTLGLSFAEASGVGLEGNNTNLCPIDGQPNALACNNYNQLTGQFGPDATATILPDGFNNYFRVNTSFGTPIIGRYFFQFEAESSEPPPPVGVPEPGTVFLLGAGLLGLVLVRRRRAELAP